jgi:mycofactocin precursor
MLLDTLTDAPIADPEPAGPGTDEDMHVPGEDPGLIEELLVEEISIDGMCGVY